MILATTNAIAIDTLCPDPHTAWIVTWAHIIDEQCCATVLDHLTTMTVIPEMILSIPNSTWKIFDVVVEDHVSGQPATFRLRFNKAHQL